MSKSKLFDMCFLLGTDDENSGQKLLKEFVMQVCFSVCADLVADLRK